MTESGQCALIQLNPTTSFPKDVSFPHFQRNIFSIALLHGFHSASRLGYNQPLWVLSLHPSSPPRCSPNLPRLSWSAFLFELWRLPPIPHLLSLTFFVKRLRIKDCSYIVSWRQAHFVRAFWCYVFFSCLFIHCRRIWRGKRGGRVPVHAHAQ